MAARASNVCIAEASVRIWFSIFFTPNVQFDKLVVSDWVLMVLHFTITNQIIYLERINDKKVNNEKLESVIQGQRDY